MNETKDIWVLIEAEGKRVNCHSIALLKEGERVSRALSCGLHAIYIGAPIENLAQEVSGCRADNIYVSMDKSLSHYQPDMYEKAILPLLKARRPNLILALSSSMGSDLMPRISFKLGAPLVTNCVDIEVQSEKELTFLKPVQKGRLNARVRCKEQGVRMATMLPQSLHISEKTNTQQASPQLTEIEKVAEDPSAALQLTGFEKADHRTIDITEAETIVAIGRGLGSKENYPLISQFADRVSGAMAGTRPTVDMGLLPYERQIGQTGKRVSPKLLFLLGISGAMEFVKGIESAGTSVAINIDRQAPVFKTVDLGIVGDLREVTPKIIEHISERTVSESGQTNGDLQA